MPPDATPTTDIQLKWAVCIRPEAVEDARLPRLFKTESDAQLFLDSEAGILPRAEADGSHQDPILNKHQSWRGPVPVRRLVDCSGRKCSSSLLRKLLPIDEVASIPKLDPKAVLQHALEVGSGSFQCCLSKDWSFNNVEAEARKRLGHDYELKIPKGIAEIIVEGAYDLEDALMEAHPNLPCSGVADFLCSWQVQRHIATFCARLSKAETVRTLALKAATEGKRFDPQNEIASARVYLYRKLVALSLSTVDDSDKTFRLNIKIIDTWIREQGWTNKDLADELKVSTRVISSMRNNGNSHGRDAVTRLANLMERPLDELYFS